MIVAAVPFSWQLRPHWLSQPHNLSPLGTSHCWDQVQSCTPDSATRRLRCVLTSSLVAPSRWGHKILPSPAAALCISARLTWDEAHARESVEKLPSSSETVHGIHRGVPREESLGSQRLHCSATFYYDVQQG